ncbi:MAG TPA: hypothetical protein VE398_06295 [Acidobacteriota bacterium]|nr:hypothetical protein [Acidobacteriota bacterium]
MESVRRAGGRFSVNIARPDCLESAEIGPVEVFDPASAEDRQSLIEAIAEAEEIATAVPSVQDYATAGPGSVHGILAEGFRKKMRQRLRRAVVYAAENHNHAAEILESHVLMVVPPEERESVRSRVRFLNTVIGKMSGAVPDSGRMRELGLAAITSSEPRAFLVESFNRILISRIRFGGTVRFKRGIAVFEEKPDLLPFEEAKLYGHNATHALAAYIGAVRGVRRIAELRGIPGVLRFLEAAFIRESGEALIRRHSGIDPLFTHGGYQEYALDLLARMTNPFLMDTVDRVGRDPERKLGWDDRLLGTMRIALRQQVIPRRYAFGAAAALATLDPSILECDTPVSGILDKLWRNASPGQREREITLQLVEEGCGLLKRWCGSGFPDLEQLFISNFPNFRK